mgnify:CR=1 FL=1
MGRWIRRTLILSFVCLGACAGGEIDSEDGAGGAGGVLPMNGGQGSGGTSPMGGVQSCRGDGDCAPNLVCNFNTGQCQPPAGQGAGGQGAGGQGGSPGNTQGCMLHSECPDGSLCNAQGQCEDIQMGGGGPGGMGGGGPQAMNACSDPASQQVINGTMVCQQSCDEMRTSAQQACNQTPARIADCLAEAEQDHTACSESCVDIATALATCGMSCVAANDPRPCVSACLGRSFQLNASCLSCYGEYFGCSFLACGAVCAQGGSIQMCVQCRQDNCGAGFQACAGIAPPY